MYERELEKKANIRFFSAVNDSQSVDVFVNRKLAFSKLPFREASSYLSLTPGTYGIEIFSNDSSNVKLLSNKIIIESGKFYTLTAVGDCHKNQLNILENSPDVPFGEAKMRFLHLAADVLAVDFAVKDRDVVFPDISFQQVTDYLGLTPMTVDLELRTAGSKQVILPMPKLQFKANETSTIVLVGSKNELSFSIIID